MSIDPLRHSDAIVGYRDKIAKICHFYGTCTDQHSLGALRRDSGILG